MNCGITDVNCHAASILNSFSEGLLGFSWTFIDAAFTGSAGNISVDQYNVATELAGRFLPIMAVVTVGVALIQIGRGAVQLNRASILMAALKAVMAWPATLLALWVAVTLTAGADTLIAVMLPDGAETFQGLLTFDTLTPPPPDPLPEPDMPFDADDPVSARAWQEYYVSQYAASDFGMTAQPDPWFIVGTSFLLSLLIWILSLILSIVMVIRNVGILALIAFAPVAWMVIGSSAAKEWSRIWIQTLIALVLAKPLAALFLLMATGMLDVASGGWNVALAIVALIMACAAPKMTMSMLRFAGQSSGVEDAAATGLSKANRGRIVASNYGMRGIKRLRGKK